jgi:hypothetical protein
MSHAREPKPPTPLPIREVAGIIVVLLPVFAAPLVSAWSPATGLLAMITTLAIAGLYLAAHRTREWRRYARERDAQHERDHATTAKLLKNLADRVAKLEEHAGDASDVDLSEIVAAQVRRNLAERSPASPRVSYRQQMADATAQAARPASAIAEEAARRALLPLNEALASAAVGAGKPMRESAPKLSEMLGITIGSGRPGSGLRPGGPRPDDSG